MPAPATVDDFLDLVRKSGVVDEKRLTSYVDELRAGPGVPGEPNKMAGLLIRDGLLTYFQAEQVLQGRWKRFTIGRYKVLERLGSGGMGQVFLCEHKMMRRRVAIKVLPTAKAEDSSSLERFYREARAVAALDHPNIVRAYDIDQDENLHFLVMEYVDGASLQDIVKKFGPMEVARACHYIYQAAVGLQHAHDVAGLVHRDIKPGNVMIDRSGLAKILDMGLARFFHDEEDIITKRYDEAVLGTADYLAPEQAIDSHAVDIRADIYSLGATFYFLLTAHPPFSEGTVAQKLIWHQTRQPKPIREYRSDVPEGLIQVINRMMAKDPKDRYQLPAEAAQALLPWVQTPIGPPPEREMPQLCAAAAGREGGPPAAPAAPRPTAAAGGPRTPYPGRPASGSFPGTDAGRAPRSAANGGREAAPPAPPRPPAGSSLRRRPAAPPNGPAAPPPRRPPGPDRGTGVHPDPYQPVWESLSGETPNPTRGNTDRVSSRSLPGRRGPDLGAPEQRWLWIALGGLGLLALAVLVWLLFFRSPGPAGGADAGVLKVTRHAPPDSPREFPSLRHALNNVRNGQTIVVLDSEIVEEPLTLPHDFRKDVTIRPADPARRVVWRLPRPPGSRLTHTAMLDVRGASGLCLRGFILDGQGQVAYAVRAAGECPGLTLKNLDIRDVKGSGVLFADVSAPEDRPILLDGVRITPGPTSQAAVRMQTGPAGGKGNRNIRLRDCRIEGPAAGVVIHGPAADLLLENNRFYDLTDAVRFELPDGPTRCEVSVVRNTFHSVDAAVHFAREVAAEPKIAAPDRVTIERNYFAKTRAVVAADPGTPLPPLSAAGNAGDPETARNAGKAPEGAGVALKPIDDPFPPPDPDNPEQFLVYDKSSPLYTAGPDGDPVGYFK